VKDILTLLKDSGFSITESGKAYPIFMDKESLQRLEKLIVGNFLSTTDKERKYKHYFKDVRMLRYIDIYKVLDLFDVKSHAVGHAIKKLICTGGRGNKGYLQDLTEARDSIQREIDMVHEKGMYLSEE